MCVQWRKEEQTFIVAVTNAELNHNHRLSKLAYAQYPANRLAMSEEVLETVDLLRKSGAKKKSMRKYILENSDASPSARDMTNIIKKLKMRERGVRSSADRLRGWMRDFCEEEPGNIGRIFTERKENKV